MKTFSKSLLLTVTVTFLLILHINAQVTLELKVFLEGPFNGISMDTELNVHNLLPLTQPYNVAPWNYAGTEQVGSIPNPEIVDWVLVELRETPGGANNCNIG